MLKVACFDFFDTLVGRSVVPEDTKKIGANQLADLLGDGITGDFIYQLRSVLEKRICSKNYQNGFDPECDLIDLARKLYAVLNEIVGEGVLQSEESFVDLLVSIELAVEKRVQTVNHEIVEILKYCRNQGLAIVIVSDFYLPAEHFQKLLSYHGLSEWVDRLFISADFLLTKGHSGRLYDIVGQKLGCALHTMVMVGDNAYADGRMASERGLVSFCVEQPEKTVTTGRRLDYEAVFSKSKPLFFPEMGISLHLFIHKLFLQAVRDHHNTLFFCSKEGEFLRKLFIRYQEIRFGRQVIASRYLLVSRKSTYICSCKGIDVEDFSRLFDHYRDMSLLEFMQSLNFCEAESLAICEQLKLEPLSRHCNLKVHQDFQTLIVSDLFRSRYQAHRLSQKESFFLYLKSFGKDVMEEGIALVDVGWKGSIQNNIYFAFDRQVKVSGYYIGLISPTELDINNQKKGILFSDFPEHSPYIHVFNNNRSLFEMVLGASHGSADGYFSQDQWNKLPYVRQSSFFQTEEKCGYPFVVVLDLPEERKLFEEHILPLQQAFFDLFEQLTDAMMSKHGKLPDFAWFAKCHARMLFRPTKEEVKYFAQLYHLENFGFFEFTSFDTTTKISIGQRLNNLISLLRDPARILETGVWPPIIFQRIGLSWLQPVDGLRRYNRIFKGEQ